MKIKETIISAVLLLAATTAQAQIKIGGNVYGGGNVGKTGGKTSVTIHAGDLNNVYGGARQADVDGSAFVHIDGEHMSGDILINRVYGGNDISGTVGSSEEMPITTPAAPGIDNTYNAFIKTTPERKVTTGEGESATTSQPHSIFIGQLFGGGNGDYDYETEYAGKDRPVMGKTYLEILGGTFGYVYGGGNNATITGKTDICIDNSSTPATRSNGLRLTFAEAGTDGVTKLENIGASSADNPHDARLMAMGINLSTYQPGYQFLRVFGGNNKADMRITPTWHLNSGSIINLYSGGNEGRMTSPNGLLLEIPATSTISAENVYGGCRKADVFPSQDGTTLATEVDNLAGYNFPADLAARVLVRGGDVNNVYGGNDISGKVYFGNAVGVYADIRGDIYGGGNGSYSYTDNADLRDDIIWGDYYYDKGSSSIDALNAFRPNAEQVSIRVAGKPDDTTVIGGAIYVGGNSATLIPDPAKENPRLELKIGSYVIADRVFMGNNGENMVDASANGVLARYHGNVLNDDKQEKKFSTIDLTDPTVFAKYMEACAMSLRPQIVFDNKENNDPATYVDFSSYFGSFFCGGNVGSMTYVGRNTLNFNKPIYIYNKVVGGCNNAYVPASDYNAAYEGGITVALTDAEKTSDPNKLVLNFDGTLMKPMRLKADKTLEWNTKKWTTSETAAAVLEDATSTGEEDQSLRLCGGNVYGGCYESGYVNGDVQINIRRDVVERDKVFGTGLVEGSTTEKRSGVDRESQYNDPLSTGLSVFAAGYGVHSEIRGNTTINISGGYVFKTYGGGEMGRVTGNCTTSITGGTVEYIYGGSFEGGIDGNTYVNLNGGTIDGVIGGSCNADIEGHAEVYIGSAGFPTIKENVNGGNDFGGAIKGTAVFSGKVSDFASDKIYNNATLTASAYVEYTQGIVGSVKGSLFGGNYGSYDYTNPLYRKYTDADGNTKEGFTKPYLSNAFVNFKPNNAADNMVANVYGGSMGYHNEIDNNKMQDRSYVLVDIADESNSNFSTTQVFGAGDFAGIGMGIAADAALTNVDKVTASAVIDLLRGRVKDVFGASYREGITRRTIVNVPAASTIHVNRVFGGAYGLDIADPCDVIEANVNWSSPTAIAEGAPENVDNKGNQTAGGIYGGNNNARRTLFAKVNINSTVRQNDKGNTGRIFGAGYGADSWARYTEVNLNNGANVYEVYGGGFGGKVLNKASVAAWGVPTSLGSYTDEQMTAIENALVTKAALNNQKYDANVHVYKGAYIGNYAYGGGLGADAIVSGTTYFDLLGGTVNKDIYGSGTSGDVRNLYESKDATTFTASTTVYIKGGTVRNVYGGGWRGSVGYHQGELHETNENDILGESHVIIGDVNGTDFLHGVPAITRNVYGGGEGGAIYGTANVTVNNGYIGYRYENGQYKEELDEPDKGDDGIGTLDESGNVFGGGYVANSYTDISIVNMYGGIVRGCLYGGGEIGPIGRGTVDPSKPKPDGIFTNGDAKIYKGGETHVYLWKGHVMRDVFGGGRGFDNWGKDGWMSDEERNTMDLSSKGYVFGSTEVRIRGGEIGTREGVQKGYGNVFGGGNVGFVYSATGTKKGERTTIAMENLTNGLPTDGGGYYYSNWDDSDRTSCQLSLDCNVVVEPYCEVTSESGITLTNTYTKGMFVPVEEVNLLGNKEADKARWDLIDWESGVTIHNAVFAGGNVVKGSDQVSVNTATVYGNVTAALRDAYNRDLITVGTEHVGGLYGDGNLTFVDGWRELHIDNWGTDYYNNDETVTLDQYAQMSDRERAYFVLNYRCIQECRDKNGETIGVGKRLTADEFKEAFDFDNYNEPTYPAEYKNYINEDGTPNPAYFEELGFCSIYAGRLLNTLQRCDMAAIWGSRIVLQGARDRVPEKADYTRYTINRVGELSLNQREFSEGSTDKHGNYFGIYSIVNYLGNLTSDVFFTETAEHPSAVRKTDSSNEDNKVDGKTYYQWKVDHKEKGNRNNGTSPNKVSLASGVYLEIIREESEKAGHTEWGLITGVVELDLIDVKTGLGGGYVYARNQHGTKEWHQDWDKVNLSPYNLRARTYKRFTYSTDENSFVDIETSGNFVHYTQQIVDDCYPNANAYKGEEKSPAHYWYIRGQIYVYDQYISAYTGSANAYAKTVSIPLTISAASHGKMTLRDVQPNRYAFYDNNGNPLGDNGSVIINEITYKAGDPIDYWSYQTLSETDQSRFVDSVYISIRKSLMSEESTDTIFSGHILLPDEYTALKDNAPKHKVSDGDDAPSVPAVYDPEQEKWVDFDFVFRLANNIGHDTGYALTFDFNNPLEWDKYYSQINGRGTDGKLSIPTEVYVDKNGEYHTVKENYIPGPTYRPKTTGVYAQRNYTLGEIMTKEIYDNYEANVKSRVASRDDQAEAERAYVVVTEFTATDKDGQEHQFYPGSPLYASDYNKTTWDALVDGNKVAAAKVCTSTLQVTDKDYVFAGTLLSPADITSLKERVVAAELTTETEADNFLKDYLSDAYYCTKAGLYGGNYFEAGKSYRTIETWNTMSADDRKNFLFNYDALDLLIDPTYGGRYGDKYQYDGYMPGSSTEPQYEGCIPNSTKIYSMPQYIDYQAEYVGDESHQDLTYTDENGDEKTVRIGYEYRIGRKEYEDIPNERAHWSPIIVTDPGTYYVVKEAFVRGDVPYTVGQTISQEVYNMLNSDQKKDYIDQIEFSDSYAGTSASPKHYFFCRESYIIGEHGEGHSITKLGDTAGVPTYNVGDRVPQNLLIDQDNYDKLVNKQAGFIIHGTAPEETATLYVSRESDINDLQKEKIITVIYLYEYQESDESGNNITPISERHVINLHINFESGVPEIGVLHKPNIVLPGTTVGLKIPTVEPGAFEITSSGWEVFANADDADLHANGQPFYNNSTPVYWYQNNYYVAYYAQTYLGKTYSNAVQFSVANYHDLKKVMDATDHHYYIDHKDVDREPKIYINDYTADGKNGLDMLKDLIDLTNDKPVAGHASLVTNNPGKKLKGGHYLEFFLRSNQNYSGEWDTPIANGSGECFSGTLHGDGYTISGLNKSLFGHLCGSVYNLGVTGSFTSAGIADEGDGYVENCWINTTGAPDGSVRAVFGNPTEESGIQVRNCYYPETLSYSMTDTHHTGLARPMPLKAFYNGEVAYDLNDFYLYKRYYDHTSAGAGAYEYKYYVDGTNSETGAAELQLKDGKYDGDYEKFVYVENRYKDGDFIYAGGTIPESADIRQHVAEGSTDVHYHPIWPDDYLFFGQALNYDHIDGRTHQDVPSHINKVNSRVQATVDGNRVYRAPAYYQSETMDMAHFNPYAVFAQTKKSDVNTIAYKDMTAIDFTGYGDAAYTKELDGKYFFQPLLDDDGLTDFRNIDLTRNLLVYTGTVAPANATTDGVVASRLSEPVYAETNPAYRTVDGNTQSVSGHQVRLIENTYTTTVDHFLVDKQDFNAPISYTMGDGHRMWYQRTPDLYVGLDKGWETVSLPFKAELVTTHQKGEITHFYSGSRSVDGETKVGHEYWLREFKGRKTDETGTDLFTALFNYPEASGEGKTVTNTFLWDYYYSKNTQKDANTDTYKTYYSEQRNLAAYPLLTNGKPYIIGFPGTTYYEFDLSGGFIPQHTAPETPARLNKQVITFASRQGETIGVSDEEIERATTSEETDYSFVPNYLSKSIAVGEGYLMNAEGNQFAKTTTLTPAVPFRPYFKKVETSGSRQAARAILFDGEGSSFAIGDDRDPSEEEIGGGLQFFTKRRVIGVSSTLREAADVRIYSTTGNTIAAFTVQPGETIERDIPIAGVYIIRADGGRIQKKLALK